MGSVADVRSLLVRAKLYSRPDSRLRPIQRFLRDGGEALRTARLGLGAQDVVLDFGGYRGDYAAALRRRYDCTVHVFEPVPAFLDEIRSRFAGDPKVVVHGAAVGASSGELTMHVSADASGSFAAGPPVTAPVMAAGELAQLVPGTVALAKLNIEGGEYELLPALEDAGMLGRIDRLFVQFHDLDEASGEQRRDCHRILERTHVCDWDYPWVWESWTRRR